MLFRIRLQKDHERWVELEEGRKYKMITRALKPLLFGKLYGCKTTVPIRKSHAKVFIVLSKRNEQELDRRKI